MTKNSDDTWNPWSGRSETSVAETLSTSNSEPVSPYDEDIDKFFRTINDVTDRFSDITKKIVGQTIEHSKNVPWWQWRDFEGKEESDLNHDVDRYFNRPYQTRSSIFDIPVHRSESFRSPFDILSRFEESSGVTPFGLFSYQGPSAKEYNTCVEKKGLSLWDSDGYWRCLFPNSQVSARNLEYKSKQLAGQIVTKEDFEESARDSASGQSHGVDLGPKGLFFRQFDDFLKWKNVSYEEEKKRVEKQREAFESRINNVKGDQSAKGEKVVVGTSLNSSTNIEGGETILKEVKTEYFNDGTSVTNSIIKKKSQGADAWETVEDKSVQGETKHGWLWSSK